MLGSAEPDFKLHVQNYGVCSSETWTQNCLSGYAFTISAGTGLNEASKLQQLALNFLATFFLVVTLLNNNRGSSGVVCAGSVYDDMKVRISSEPIATNWTD